jgi:hypothetical protein
LKKLYVTQQGDDDVEKMVEFLENANIVAPLPQLRDFDFANQDDSLVDYSDGRRKVPFDLLKRMPKLTSLFVEDDNYISHQPHKCRDMLTVQGFRQLRSVCPHLEYLGLGVALQGPYARWPIDILNELARFEQLIILTIHICHPQTKRARLSKNDCDYWLAA